VTSLFNLLGPQAPDNLSPADAWQNHALCGDDAYDPEMWFPVGEGTAAQQQADDAKAVCYRCPVVDVCLRWALDSRQDAGVWGGLTERERRRLHRRKARIASAPRTTRSLADVLAERSISVGDGHTEWAASSPVTVNRGCYTPAQLAWHVAHGEAPDGEVRSTCGHAQCITASHLLDRAGRAAQHGTHAALNAHRNRGEDLCDACQVLQDRLAANRSERDRARRAARRAPAERSAA
jgi:WhiB family redox-sensing transcriptional regulator